MLGSTNERRRHVLKSSPLGWSRTHNDPCITVSLGVWCGNDFFSIKIYKYASHADAIMSDSKRITRAINRSMKDLY